MLTTCFSIVSLIGSRFSVVIRLLKSLVIADEAAEDLRGELLPTVESRYGFGIMYLYDIFFS